MQSIDTWKYNWNSAIDRVHFLWVCTYTHLVTAFISIFESTLRNVHNTLERNNYIASLTNQTPLHFDQINFGLLPTLKCIIHIPISTHSVDFPVHIHNISPDK